MDDLGSTLRSLVTGVDVPVPLQDGKMVPAINFDNAATTPPFVSVMQAIANFAPWYSSIHRGTGYKSIISSDLYEHGRETIREFVHADCDKDIVIYTKNTTEAVNMLAYILFQQDAGQVIISTEMEHLANDLPWRAKFHVEYAAVDACGQLSLEDLEAKLRRYADKVKLVAVAGASNVSGYINPIDKIAALAHQYGAKIFVDGAQLVPHCAVDMKEHGAAEHIDFLAWSAHKMYAPFGLGILIGPKEVFSHGDPVYQGGGAVQLVSRRLVQWDDPPYKDEAGTPNAMGVVALLAAMKTLNSIGKEDIFRYEQKLICYALDGLESIPGVRLFCRSADRTENRVSLISFALPGLYHRTLARALSWEAGIAVRSGLFCAHPYVEKLMQMSAEDLDYYHSHPNAPVPGLVRISLGLYNTVEEIDKMLDIVSRIARCPHDYEQKYSLPDEQDRSFFGYQDAYRHWLP